MATDLQSFASEYKSHLSQREAQGIPPLPLSADQAAAVCSALRQKDLDPGLLAVHGQANTVASLRYLISERVPPGVYPASKVKAEFLADLALGRASSPHLEKMETLEMLAAMGGGYNTAPLIEVLSKGGDAGGQGGPAARGSVPGPIGGCGSRRPAGREWKRTGAPPARGLGGGPVVLPSARDRGGAAPQGDPDHRRDQHRLLLSGPGGLHPGRHPAARPVHPQHQPRRPRLHRASHQARSRRPAAAVRGGRGGYRLQPQVRLQLAGLVDRRRHPPRAQQAPGRHADGRQDRAHLLQHHSRLRGHPGALLHRQPEGGTGGRDRPDRGPGPVGGGQGSHRVPGGARLDPRGIPSRRPQQPDHRPQAHDPRQGDLRPGWESRWESRR